MITAEFEIELLCFIRTYEAKGYKFCFSRDSDSSPDIRICAITPRACKAIKAKRTRELKVGNETFFKSSRKDLEQFMHTVKLYDQVNNKRAA